VILNICIIILYKCGDEQVLNYTVQGLSTSTYAFSEAMLEMSLPWKRAAERESVIQSPSLVDGNFYCFEGMKCVLSSIRCDHYTCRTQWNGCYPLNCTHVLNYTECQCFSRYSYWLLYVKILFFIEYIYTFTRLS